MITMIDARVLLKQFTDHGDLDTEKCISVISEVLKSATQRTQRPLRVFGEMVMILWEDGFYETALQLEELWNHLQQMHSFFLHCAYSMSGLRSEALLDSVSAICSKHDRILPPETYAEISDPREKMRTVIQLQQRAELLENEIAVRRKAEIRLHESEQRYRSLFEASRDSFLILDAQTLRIHDANLAACELFHMPRSQLLNLSLVEIGLLRSKAQEKEMIQSLLAQQVYQQPQLLIRTKDGNLKSVEFLASQYREESRNVVQCNIRDVTDRVDAEKALLVREHSARLEAEKLNRMKDEFMATVSHELRTPLNSMLGWARILRAANVEPQLHARAVSNIEQSVKVQKRLIEDMFDVSRIISGKLRINMSALKLEPIIEAAIDTVRPAADAKNIHISFEFDCPEAIISADPARIQQVLWNLLSNSIKFTPPHGEVRIKLRRTDTEAEVTVRDNGEGISAQFLPHVFDRFIQADGTTTRRHGGLGLGLAIVRHLVELHGGTVTAESDGPGRGASFCIRLPIAASGALLPGIEST